MTPTKSASFYKFLHQQTQKKKNDEAAFEKIFFFWILQIQNIEKNILNEENLGMKEEEDIKPDEM